VLSCVQLIEIDAFPMFDFRESLRMMLQFTFCFQHFIDSHSKSCPFRKVEHQTKVGKYELLHEGEPDKSKSRCTRVSCDFHSLLYCPIHDLYTGTRCFQWPCNGDCAGNRIITFDRYFWEAPRHLFKYTIMYLSTNCNTLWFICNHTTHISPGESYTMK
jgi:hypothetical protein